MPRFTPRVIVFPAVILLMAVGLSWWSSRQSDAGVERIRAQVTQWCEAAGRGENPAARLPADEYLARPLGTALTEVCSAEPDTVRVQVAAGPAPGRHAVKVTHHALVLRGETPLLGISFHVSGEQTTIVGYWKEQ